MADVPRSEESLSPQPAESTSALATASEWRHALAAAFLPLLLLAFAHLLSSGLNYNRHDNFEYFTQVISEAHGQWLEGQIPYWNPHQFLGEPLIATPHTGASYPFHTLAYLLTRVFGWGDASVCLVIVLLHAPVLGLGWFMLLRRLTVRPAFAVAGAIAASSGGFLTVLSSVWIHIYPESAWLPWALWGALGVVGLGPRIRDYLVLTASLVAIGYAAHPQMNVYVWMLVASFAVPWAFVVHRSVMGVLRLLPPLIAAVLILAPVILPTLSLLPHTDRGGAMSLEAFLERGFSPAALAGLLLPVYGIDNACLKMNTAALAFQGSWVLPTMVLSTVVVIRSRAGLPDQHDESESDVALRRHFIIAAIVSIVFLLLAMGSYGFVYRLTHGLPVWSSLRWPFKILMVACPAFVLGGALGLELCGRRLVGGARWPWITVALGATLAGALLLFRAGPAASSVAGVLAIITGLVLLVLPAALNQRWPQRLLVAFVGLQAVCTLAICHDYSGMTTYQETYGSVGPEELGIDTAYRVLPLSPMPELEAGSPSYMQQYGLYHSATANGYFGATGHITAVAPTWYRQVLNPNLSGLLAVSHIDALLPSHLLRSLNVKYLILDKRLKYDELEPFRGYQRLTELDRVLVLANDDALPRAYFASEVRPYSSEALRQGLLLNRAPLRTAFVVDEDRASTMAAGEIIDADWRDSGVDFRVRVPETSFLVISICYDPAWQAQVDGQAVPVRRVNGTLIGMELPAGSSEVVVRYRSRPLETGCVWAGIGVALLVVWTLYTRRKAVQSLRH